MKILFVFLFALSSIVHAAPPAECDGVTKCIRVTWLPPVFREDGSSITNLDGYRVYHSIDNTPQTPIDLAADAIEHYIVNPSFGVHTITISAVESGLEGTTSEPVSATLIQAKIGPVSLTIEVF